MAINDIITVGATPISVHAYWATGGSDWFADEARARDLVNGWKRACDKCGVRGAAAKHLRWPASWNPTASIWRHRASASCDRSRA